MATELRIGTSGYAYRTWCGSFYPKTLQSSEFLAYYARQFSTVEINSTFYRMPKPEMLQQWKSQVPAAFAFVLKAPQAITHHARLKQSAQAAVAHFYSVAQHLGRRLGPVFFQLPPNLRKDLPRLSTFLTWQPKGTRMVIEFRHLSWFDDEVYALLRKHRVALCIADTDEGTTPRIATTNFGYVRLRRARYTARDLARWHASLQEHAWRRAFVFFKHEDAGVGPKLAQRLQTLA